MARGNRLSAPKSGSSNGSNGGYQSYLWIVFCLILLAIILFAIFYPRRQYNKSVQNGNMMQPYPMMQIESFENEDENDSDVNYKSALMEQMGNNNDPKKIMSSDKPCIIFFYAPWCGHCKNAKPEFEKLMKMAKGKAYMIDCDDHKDIAQKYGIQGFPTIRYYPKGPKNGNPREYNGNRTAKDMMDFMR
jgi:protein disulfide-isomerase-like protein